MYLPPPCARCADVTSPGEDDMTQRPSHRRQRQHTDRRSKSRAQDSGLSRFQAHAAGIDVGASDHWVAVPADRDDQPVRRFGTFTADLYAIAQWLEQCHIQTIVMESTGIYWIPLFEVLETPRLDVKLVDAHYPQKIPWPKKDGPDCPGPPERHRYPLLRGGVRSRS